MPKPFANLTGSGSHAHMSLWDAATGECVSGGGEVAMHKLSGTSLSFLAGMLEHAPALLAITNPTVNSYKRLNARGTNSGATWSPTAATWAGNNRSALVRVPGGARRMELRVADMAANPYLMAAGMGAAGLDGLNKGVPPPPPCDRNMYDLSDPIVAAAVQAAPPLPKELPAALDNLDGSGALREHLGNDLVESYLKARRRRCRRTRHLVACFSLLRRMRRTPAASLHLLRSCLHCADARLRFVEHCHAAASSRALGRVRLTAHDVGAADLPRLLSKSVER